MQKGAGTQSTRLWWREDRLRNLPQVLGTQKKCSEPFTAHGSHKRLSFLHSSKYDHTFEVVKDAMRTSPIGIDAGSYTGGGGLQFSEVFKWAHYALAWVDLRILATFVGRLKASSARS